MTRRDLFRVLGITILPRRASAVLLPSEYDASYFDGLANPPGHPAGYDEYTRKSLGRHHLDDSGELYADIARAFTRRANFTNRTVLELGCAKGFIVKSLRDLGIDASGLDISSYAIGEAEVEAQPHVQVADALTFLSAANRNAFDYIVSRQLFECFEDADITNLVTECNRAARHGQLHIMSELDRTPTSTFYNFKTIAEWGAFNWESGARIVSVHDDLRELVK